MNTEDRKKYVRSMTESILILLGQLTPLEQLALLETFSDGLRAELKIERHTYDADLISKVSMAMLPFAEACAELFKGADFHFIGTRLTLEDFARLRTAREALHKEFQRVVWKREV